MKKRKGFVVAAGVVLAIFIMIYSNTLPGSNEQVEQQSDQPATVQTQTDASTDSGTNVSTEAGTNAVTDTDSKAKDSENPIRVTDLKGLVAGGCIKVVVKRIVDGDTIRVDYQDKEHIVRLLCIDTPESVKQNVKVQPFGKQAAEKLEEMILGKAVQLLFEKDLRDKYDRLLAYVILEDGTCVNATMVSEGFARVNAVKPNIVHLDYFNELQGKAISKAKGLWALPEEERPFVKKR